MNSTKLKIEDDNNIVIKNHYNNIEDKNHLHIITDTIYKHKQIFGLFFCVIKYLLCYRSRQTKELVLLDHCDIYPHPTPYHYEDFDWENHSINAIDKMIQSNNENIHPFFYKNWAPKPMMVRKLFMIIDRDFEKYTHWGCRNRNNQVKRYVCAKLYSTIRDFFSLFNHAIIQMLITESNK